MANALRTLVVEVAVDARDLTKGFDQMAVTTTKSIDQVEKELNEFGLHIGKVEKAVGKQTQAARKAWQEQTRLDKAYNNTVASIKAQTAAIGANNSQLEIDANVRRLGADATDEQKREVEQLTKALQQQRAANDAAAEAQRKAIADQQRLDDAYRDTVDSIRAQTTAIGKSNDQLEIDANVRRLGANATEQQKREIEALTKTMQQQRAANDSNVNGLKKLRNVAGQAGYQVGDLAVQLQGGTNAMVAIGQQGSQLAGAFGPTGAIVGAIIAVASALGTAFAPAMFDSGKATQELVDKIKALGDSVVYTAAQTGTLVEAEEKNIETKEKEIKALEAKARVNQRDIDLKKESVAAIQQELEAEQNREKVAQRKYESDRAYQRRLDQQNARQKILIDNLAKEQTELDKSTKKLSDNQAERDTLNQEIDKHNENITKYNSLNDETLATQESNTNQLAEFIKNLQEENATLGLSNQALNTRTLKLLGATAAQHAEVAALQLSIDKKNEQIEQEKELERLAQQEQQRNQQLAKQILTDSMTKQEALQAELEKRQQAIDQANLTDEEWHKAEVENQRWATEEKLKILRAEQAAKEQILNSYADLTMAVFDEETAAYAAAAIAKKAFTLYNVLMSSQDALAEAMAMPFPANIAATAKVAAKTGVIQATVNAITVPAFDKGGFIQPGQSGLVSEYGNELVNGVLVKGPARVTSREETNNLINRNGATINFNVTANDAAGFDRLLIERRSLIHNLVRQAMADEGQTL